MHPSRPDTLFMQKHWDVMRSDDAGGLWHEISGDLPSTIRQKGSCAFIAAAPAATNGSL